MEFFKKSPKISRFQLKILALICMTLSHIASIVLKTSLLQQIFLFIGAIAMPIYCFLLAEGFQYTQNKTKYFFRLFFFGLIGNFAYSYSYGTPLFFLSAITALAIGFCVLCVYESSLHASIKFWLVIILLGISFYGDWGLCAPLWILVFYCFKEKTKLKYILFVAVGILFNLVLYFFFSVPINLGFVLAVLILKQYDSKIIRNEKWKRAFYWYYPIHLILLKLLSCVV